MAVLPDVWADWRLSPRVIQVLDTLEDIAISDLHDTCRTLEAQPQNSDDKKLIDTEGYADLGDSKFTGLTSTLNDAKLAFEPRLTSKQSGTATTANSKGERLIDSAALFESNGVQPGATIINFTDGSATSVIEVVSETELYCWRLKDGTDNQFEIGDSYKVWNVIQCEVKLGNLVAKDDVGATTSPILPTAFTQVIISKSTEPGLIGGVVSPATVAAAVWDKLYADHASPSTMGWVMSKLIRASIEGNMKQDQGQHIIYDPDSPSTPLITFDTLDQSGQPANVKIYERQKV